MTPRELLLAAEGHAMRDEIADYRLARLGTWIYASQGTAVETTALLDRPLRQLKLLPGPSKPARELDAFLAAKRPEET